MGDSVKSPKSWRTPGTALELIKHLIPTNKPVVDPCAGEGAIVEWLSDNGFEAYGIEIDSYAIKPPVIQGNWFNLVDRYQPGCNIVTTPPTMLGEKFIASFRCDFAAVLVVPLVGYKRPPTQMIDAGMVNDTPMQWRIFKGRDGA